MTSDSSLVVLSPGRHWRCRKGPCHQPSQCMPAGKCLIQIPAIKLAPANDRGFLRGEFKDRNDAVCSIQKSSIATEDCIWLGCERRMHLTQAMVADLLPLLQHFVATGDLPEDREP